MLVSGRPLPAQAGEAASSCTGSDLVDTPNSSTASSRGQSSCVLPQGLGGEGAGGGSVAEISS